jgi:hypothetical protein
MRMRLGLAALLGCAAGVMPTGPSFAQAPPLQGQPLPPPAQNLQACRSFTAPVTVGGGATQLAVGKTCQQPDGSLQITLETPGLPPQTYTMPPPPAEDAQALPSQPPPPSSTATYPAPYPYPYPYPYPAPYYWSDPWAFGGFPFFAGGAFVFVGDRFFFRDRFGHFHDGFRGRFPAGFAGAGFSGRVAPGGGFHGGGHR